MRVRQAASTESNNTVSDEDALLRRVRRRLNRHLEILQQEECALRSWLSVAGKSGDFAAAVTNANGVLRPSQRLIWQPSASTNLDSDGDDDVHHGVCLSSRSGHVLSTQAGLGLWPHDFPDDRSNTMVPTGGVGATRQATHSSVLDGEFACGSNTHSDHGRRDDAHAENDEQVIGSGGGNGSSRQDCVARTDADGDVNVDQSFGDDSDEDGDDDDDNDDDEDDDDGGGGRRGGGSSRLKQLVAAEHARLASVDSPREAASILETTRDHLLQQLGDDSPWSADFEPSWLAQKPSQPRA